MKEFALDIGINGLKKGRSFWLTLCMLGNSACFLLSAVFYFSKLTFSKHSFGNTIRASNSLTPDQARHFVGPDLGSNCLQKLSADDTGRLRVRESIGFMLLDDTNSANGSSEKIGTILVVGYWHHLLGPNKILNCFFGHYL